MADSDSTRVMPDGKVVPSGTHGSPGISGAISDAVAALAGYFAPSSITHRKANIDQAVDDASGDTPAPKSLGSSF